MVEFILIEDDLLIHNTVEKIIVNLLFSKSIEFNIQTFINYNSELQKVIESSSMKKIYIIDIQLAGKISGISIAEKIREKDWDSEIIFITNHSKMFEKVFNNILNVFSFIEKFHNFEERLTADIKRIISHKIDNETFNFSKGKIDLRIRFKEIIYIFRETSTRKIHIITTNNEFIISMNIKDIMLKLDGRFAQVHRACIVNKDRIVKYDWRNKYFETDNKKKKIKENLTKIRGDMMFGIVRWFDLEKGYGFVVYKDLENIFIHYSDVLNSQYKTLIEGQKVSFKLVETSRGLRAKEVYIVD